MSAPSGSRTVILDVDTGHDDAVAIIMAARNPSFSIAGITVTAGNQTLPKTLANTLNLCSELGIDAPVFAGMTRPLLAELKTAARIHGESGLDGPVFGPCTKQVETTHAAVFIAETVMKHAPKEITLVATGPLSNIAMALRLEPAIATRVSEIVLMGGSATVGNVTPSAEFNIHADPEAAAIVFSSNAPIVMFGLDVTRKLELTDARFNRFSRTSGRVAQIFRSSMEHYIAACKSYLGESPAMHDPCCIAYLEDPSMFTFKNASVAVETTGSLTKGRTVVDFTGLSLLPMNVRVACDVAAERFWQCLEAAFARFP